MYAYRIPTEKAFSFLFSKARHVQVNGVAEYRPAKLRQALKGFSFSAFQFLSADLYSTNQETSLQDASFCCLAAYERQATKWRDTVLGDRSISQCKVPIACGIKKAVEASSGHFLTAATKQTANLLTGASSFFSLKQPSKQSPTYWSNQSPTYWSKQASSCLLTAASSHLITTQ